MLQSLRISLALLLSLTLLTGIVYPGIVTAIAHAAFPNKANGSVIQAGGKPAGSELVGQLFTRPEYFWGRLSATSPMPYNAAASSGSQYGPIHPGLKAAAEARIAALAQHPAPDTPVPVDLVTSSGSGLDPHITPAAAEYQIPRIAASRGMTQESVRDLVRRHTQGRQFGLLGEARVHVLKLNLALDQQQRRE